MELNDYQREAKKTAIYPSFGASYIYPALGLAGETGEVVEKIKKLVRNKNGIVDGKTVIGIKQELGDVLWYVAVLASCFGIALEDVATANIKKIEDRVRRGVINSEGDNR